MAKIRIHLTANFEGNLQSIEQFLAEAGAPQVYDHLLDELIETVIPNLERFPDIGPSFLARRIGSVEASNALDALRGKLGQGELREYLLPDYLLLYARYGEAIHLLSIKHHRQLSFDFAQLWETGRN